MTGDAAVPFLDVGATYRELASAIDRAIEGVLQSGWFLLGPQLESFEINFARFEGAKHAVGVGSGLDALVLTLRALGVGPGDEVIVPSHTFIATWLAVSAVGAEIVPVEPGDDPFLIDSVGIEARISPRTAAIIPVHLYGMPVDLEPILQVAERHGIAVVSDAAQAHGSTLSGHPTGGLGTAACWSFYPGKNLGAFGDGGAVTTNDAALAARVRALRNYGSTRKYVHEVAGTNSRLDEIQAAILNTKLSSLHEWNTRRTIVADRYLRDLVGAGVELPPTYEDRTSSWHLFVVRCASRDRLQHSLREAGVETIIHYPTPPHVQGAYHSALPSLTLPVAEQLARECLSLPIGPHMTEAQTDAVIEAVQSSLSGTE